PHVAAARLQRALLTLDRGNESAAVREFAEVIRTDGTAAVQQHAAIASAFATRGAETALESPSPGPPVGREDSIERFAVSVLDTPEPQAPAPLLHGVVLVAAADRGWTNTFVDSLANRLFDGFPSYDPAPVVLSRVAAAAASGGNWQAAIRN